MIQARKCLAQPALPYMWIDMDWPHRSPNLGVRVTYNCPYKKETPDGQSSKKIKSFLIRLLLTSCSSGQYTTCMWDKDSDRVMWYPYEIQRCSRKCFESFFNAVTNFFVLHACLLSMNCHGVQVNIHELVSEATRHNKIGNKSQLVLSLSSNWSPCNALMYYSRVKRVVFLSQFISPCLPSCACSYCWRLFASETWSLWPSTRLMNPTREHRHDTTCIHFIMLYFFQDRPSTFVSTLFLLTTGWLDRPSTNLQLLLNESNPMVAPSGSPLILMIKIMSNQSYSLCGIVSLPFKMYRSSIRIPCRIGANK